jgi:hypothetical protein
MRVVPFSASLLGRVQDFECGAAEWQLEVANFLKAPPNREGAAQFVAEQRASVSLYESDEGELIGYGCLGTADWWLQHPDEQKRRRHVIQMTHFLGLRPKFWGKPDKVQPHERYAWIILEDLMGEAVERLKANKHWFPGVGGLVHHENGRALRFLERFGFRTLDPGLVGYLRVLYPL